MDDFDFLTGTWDVRNRWRTHFLDETCAWEEFPGLSRVSRHFDGAANFDEIDFPTKGFSGLTLRLYDPGTAQCSLYWASKRTGADLADQLDHGVHPVTGVTRSRGSLFCRLASGLGGGMPRV